MPALRRIAAEFGAEMLTSAGDLDRTRMGRAVFADDGMRQKLECILHPPIRSLLRAQIEAAQRDLPPDTVIVVEIPLLYEGGLETWFDQVVVVTAPETLQRERLHERNGLKREESRRRIAAQWPLARKIARADHVVVNAGSLLQLEAAVNTLWPLLKRGRNNA